MPRAVVRMHEGKALYNGRSLSDWLPDVAARIFERSDAEMIISFGSVERGDDGPDSDIDLIVVLPKITRRHDDAVKVMRELRDLPVPIDLTVTDANTIASESHLPGLLRVALREGRVLERAA